MNGISEPNAIHQPKVKVEDKMDEDQLTRLATGVTLDSSSSAAAVIQLLAGGFFV
jgi:histone acetyltransferase